MTTKSLASGIGSEESNELGLRLHFFSCVNKAIACVASGSARVRRENWNESKKRNEGGGGGGGE